MLICSHRGEHSVAPENSMRAFERARDSGLAAIETDVRVTLDGQLALFHDRSLPDGSSIDRLSLQTLRDRVGFDVPTLAEALNSFRSTRWYIEIKDPSCVPQLRAELATRRSTHDFVVISFWHTAARQLCEALGTECGLTMCHRPDVALTNLIPATNANLTTCVWNYEFVDRELVKEHHAAGLQCFVYGPILREEHDHCRELKLDGVITDYPDYLSVNG